MQIQAYASSTRFHGRLLAPKLPHKSEEAYNDQKGYRAYELCVKAYSTV